MGMEAWSLASDARCISKGKSQLLKCSTIWRLYSMGCCIGLAAQVQTAADMPENPAWLFSNANVVNGEFIYEGSSRNTRYTVALVTYADEKDRYTEKVEYVEDPDGIAKYGVKTVSPVAVGATSRGQARRYGANILLTSRLLTETVSFTMRALKGLAAGLFPEALSRCKMLIGLASATLEESCRRHRTVSL